MNALKAHKRYEQYLAEQQRKQEQQRIANMTPEERKAYDEECARTLKQLKEHLRVVNCVNSMIQHPYKI